MVVRQLTAAKVGMCSLIKEQRLLQVARSCDFLRLAIWTWRVALVAALDPLALEIMSGMRAFRVCVE
jgi:hypothetical protein